MFQYPLGSARVSINGHDLSEYHAKLAASYGLGSSEITNTWSQGPDRGGFSLLRQAHGLMPITLPLHFCGRNKRDTMAGMTAFSAQCAGDVDLDLGDGYHYRCVLEDTGETAWYTDDWCTVDYHFQGIRMGPEEVVCGPAPLSFYCHGTWPKNECVITVKDLDLPYRPAVVSLSQEGRTYLSWHISNLVTLRDGDLVLDGIRKRNLFHRGSIPAGIMTYTDYPYLLPGKSTLSVSGVENAQVELRCVPAYL